MDEDRRRIAATIDHTILAPEATAAQIDTLCDEAMEYGFAGVCVNPVYIKQVAHRLLEAQPPDSHMQRPKPVAVVGFPLGSNTSTTKAEEARHVVGEGAEEVDMVIHLGSLIASDGAAVTRDIEAVVKAAQSEGTNIATKVILETGALTDEQIVLGCRCAVTAGADFVKTSTGFHKSGGAQIAHVRLMVQHAAPLQVKASGGVRSAEALLAMLEAGATRIGTSSGVAIMQQVHTAGS